MPRKSVYLPDSAMEIIGTEEQGRFSPRLAGIINDYNLMIKASMPELTQNEWLFLADMLNGVVLESRQTQFLGSDIAESGKLDGLSEKWEVNAEDFARRVDALPLPAKIAIHDVAFQFWQKHGIVNDWKELLLKCGANVRKE